MTFLDRHPATNKQPNGSPAAFCGAPTGTFGQMSVLVPIPVTTQGLADASVASGSNMSNSGLLAV
ncbi:MAG: hypothetical protein ACLQIB_53765 [Isosphaeraceae bacterium]